MSKGSENSNVDPPGEFVGVQILVAGRGGEASRPGSI